jgi:hypothetical protein
VRSDQDARIELGQWFMKMLEELDEDQVREVEAIDDLKDRVAETFARWRLGHGYGVGGRGT